MCFSWEWVGHLLIWLVCIIALVAIVKLLVPYFLSLLGAPDGGLIGRVLMILIWAVVACAVIYVVIGLLQCVSGGGMGFPSLHYSR